MVNKVILVGNVGKDPETRSMQDGKQVASFSIATSESWKDTSGERKTKTEWHSIVVFNPGLVKLISYSKKGSKVYVEGKLQTRKWKDQSGQDRYITEVVIPQFGGQIVLLDKKEETKESVKDEFVLDDEIPFE